MLYEVITYAHSNGSKGPHLGYINIGNENEDLNSSSQTWYDTAYTSSQAKSLYNYTVITSYSIHYTKLYDRFQRGSGSRGPARRIPGRVWS